MIKFCYFFIVLFIISCTSATQKEEQEEATFPVGQIKCPKGEILIWLHDGTPAHKASFIKLANENYWDSLTFNRVIEGFVVQGGCPDTPEGFGDSPYLMDGEFVDSLRHIYGAVGAGRDDNPEKKSAACQFYIVQAKEGIQRLDGDYTIFGQVIKGMEVVDSIVKMETDSLNMPLIPLRLDVNIIQLTEMEIQEIKN